MIGCTRACNTQSTLVTTVYQSRDGLEDAWCKEGVRGKEAETVGQVKRGGDRKHLGERVTLELTAPTE